MKKGLLLVSLVTASLTLFAGSAQAVIYTPSSLSFAPQIAGTMSAPQEVKVGGGYCGPDMIDPNPPHNITPGPCFVEPSDIAVSGDFKITGNNCPAQLQSFSIGSSTYSCSVFVAFAPTGAGAKAGFLRVASNPSIVGAPLSGTGLVCFKTPKGKHVCSATPPKKKKKRKKHH